MSSKSVDAQCGYLFNGVRFLFCGILLGCTSELAGGGATIPQVSDWIDCGVAVDAGIFGIDNDVLFEGATPCAMIKKDATYYLFYVQVDDYISQKNNVGPARRSLGVASSTDGIRWTKYHGNPVLTWSVTGNPEEGVPSCGMSLDANEEFVGYYGANTSTSPTGTNVRADCRLTVSSDGFNFTDEGMVLDHADPNVFGYGDELHSVMALTNAGKWYCYYIPNGTAQRNMLGVAWGTDPGYLPNVEPVLQQSDMSNVPARGTCGVCLLDANTLAFFLSQPNGDVVARTTTLNALNRMSDTIETYHFGFHGKALVYLDTSKNTWFAYINGWGYIGLLVAPAGPPDATPPTAPANLTATGVQHDTVSLVWDPAVDPDTGIIEYNVYRDGSPIGTARNSQFVDTGLTELTLYNYEVRAVNFHGTEGPADFDSVTTPPDVSPPEIEIVTAGGDPSKVIVVFDEPVEQSSAETPINYTIGGGITVSAASLEADGKTVELTTSPQITNALYAITVNNVMDLAATPNSAATQGDYTYSASEGLVGYWRLDEGMGALAADTSGFGNDGTRKDNPTPAGGKIDGALSFDGIDDNVEMDLSASLKEASYGSFTTAAWVKPASLPPDTTASNGAYTFFEGPYWQLRYEADGTFAARLGGGYQNPLFELRSEAFDPEVWHHLAMAKDNVAKKLYFYVDGQPVSGSPLDFTGDPVSNYVEALPEGTAHKEYYTKFRIGALNPDFDDTSNYTYGCIDDVRIYRRVLTAGEICLLPGGVHNQPPVAAIYANPTSGLLPLTVSFDGSGSSDGDGEILNYDWNFGDGNTDFGAVVNHTYTAAGTYTATLTVIDDRDAADTNSVTITVTGPPVEITAWYSAGEHGHGVGELQLEITDDGSFCEPQSSGVETLIVEFSEAIDPATFTPDSIDVVGLDANAVPVDLSGITIGTDTRSGDTAGEITFSPALPDFARYAIRITGLTSAVGGELVGDNDRILTELVGDVSGDLRVNATDFSRVRSTRTKLIDPGDVNQVRADVSMDGRINAADLSRIRARRGNDARSIPDPVFTP